MPVYRDDLHMPNVVVISETALTEQGVLEDALLFVLDATESRVTLTDEHGEARLFTLPEAALAGDYPGKPHDFLTENPT